MTLEFLDEVSRQMGVQTDPPAGMVVHTHFEEGGQVRVIDVWDSQEAFDSFAQTSLMPTMQKVAAERGIETTQAPQPEPTFLPVHGLVKGR